VKTRTRICWLLAFTVSGMLAGLLCVGLILPWIDHTNSYAHPLEVPVLVASTILLFGYMASMVAFRFGLEDRSRRARVYRGMLVAFPLWILPVLLVVLGSLSWIMDRLRP
jgi:membrane associated rhomboid family serine protease